MSYPAYPEYKDSGVEWLGEVPEHWLVSRLKFFGNLVTGVTPPSEDLDNYAGFGWPWVTPDDLDESGKPVQASKFLTDKGWSYCRSVRPKSILVCCIGSIGKLGYTETVVSTNQQITAVQPHYGSRYLFYLLSDSKSELALRAAGNVLNILNSDRLSNLPVLMPPKDEAEQIARFLDYGTARIEALIEEQQRLIELLKEKRLAVISHAVTKGLDPDVPMKDSGVEWLGEVPAHWLIGRLRWYASVQGGIAKGKSYEAGVETVERPYLRVANVQDGYVDLSEVYSIEVSEIEAKHYELKPGDVLMNEGGDNDKLGRGTVWRGEIEGCLHQNHVFSIRPNESLSPEWLAIFTRSDSARSYFYLYSKQSTNLASISSGNLMSCPLPVPPREEQERIINVVDEKMGRINSLMEVTETAMELLEERRSALISAAVTGKIDVRDWTPPDSSAEPEHEHEGAAP